MDSNNVGHPESDRRAYFRINASFPVAYRLKPGPDESGEEEEFQQAESQVNLSAGGVGLVVPERLDLNTKLILKLSLPGGPPILVGGKVVRSNAVDPKEPRTRIGVQFTALGDKERERISAYVFSLQVERRRTRYV